MQEVTDPARRAVNPKPKWAVPIELIEWQAAYTQEVLPCACRLRHVSSRVCCLRCLSCRQRDGCNPHGFLGLQLEAC